MYIQRPRYYHFPRPVWNSGPPETGATRNLPGFRHLTASQLQHVPLSSHYLDFAPVHPPVSRERVLAQAPRQSWLPIPACPQDLWKPAAEEGAGALITTAWGVLTS